MIQLEILTGTEHHAKPMKVEAVYLQRGLAYHRDPGNHRWSLTHIPSGRHFVVQWTRAGELRESVKAANRAVPGVRWDRLRVTLAAGAKLTELQQQWYEALCDHARGYGEGGC